MGLTLLSGKIQQSNEEPKNNPSLHFINGAEAGAVIQWWLPLLRSGTNQLSQETRRAAFKAATKTG